MKSLKHFLSCRLAWFWYRPVSLISLLLVLLLLPFSFIFGVVSYLRRKLFQANFFKTVHLSVPVVIIGNLTVGGTGKTPLTMALAREMASLGYQVGMISRGYGGSRTEIPMEVYPHSSSREVGDESILLATVGSPVFVCQDRVAAGQALLKQYPNTNLILCDDGLQHYHLHRKVEICVLDGHRGLGNRFMLPAGPLREPICRLEQVDAVVINGSKWGNWTPQHPSLFQMSLVPGTFFSLNDPGRASLPQDFSQCPIAALCGIGNPDRFFETLTHLGLQFDRYYFSDHYVFCKDDLPDVEVLLVTEKDAVKLVQLPDLGKMGDRIWVLPVTATLPPELGIWLDKKLRYESKIT